MNRLRWGVLGVAGIATFETLGNNTVRQNGAASAGPITTVAPM